MFISSLGKPHKNEPYLLKSETGEQEERNMINQLSVFFKKKIYFQFFKKRSVAQKRTFFIVTQLSFYLYLKYAFYTPPICCFDTVSGLSQSYFLRKIR